MERNLNKSILNLAIPNIISNITIPLLGIVDIALMGHMGSMVYIGAIGLGSTIFSVLYSFFSFMRAGTTGFTAQAYGAENRTEIIYSLYRSIAIAILASILILSLQNPIAKLSYALLEGSEEVKEMALLYFYVRIWAAPANMLMYAFNGWFVGMQNTKIPMTIAITINVLNIILSITFVRYFNMNVRGVALGTVISQYCGLLMAILFIALRYSEYFIKPKFDILLKLNELTRFFKVNTDLMIRSVLLILTIAFFTNQSAKLGDDILAINMIILQFFNIFSYFTDGFAYAGEALVGKFKGAGNFADLKRVIKYLLLWGLALTIPFSIVYAAFPELLIGIISSDTTLIDATLLYHIFIILIPVITFAAFVWDGIYIGATASKPIRNTMVISSLAVFLPAWYFLTPVLGNNGLWISFLLFMLSRTTIMTLLSKQIVNK